MYVYINFVHKLFAYPPDPNEWAAKASQWAQQRQVQEQYLLWQQHQQQQLQAQAQQHQQQLAALQQQQQQHQIQQLQQQQQQQQQQLQQQQLQHQQLQAQHLQQPAVFQPPAAQQLMSQLYPTPPPLSSQPPSVPSQQQSQTAGATGAPPPIHKESVVALPPDKHSRAPPAPIPASHLVRPEHPQFQAPFEHCSPLFRHGEKYGLRNPEFPPRERPSHRARFHRPPLGSRPHTQVSFRTPSWKPPDSRHPPHLYTGDKPPTEAMFTEDSPFSGFYEGEDEPGPEDDNYQSHGMMNDGQSRSTSGDNWTWHQRVSAVSQPVPSSSPIPLFQQTPLAEKSKEEECPVRQEVPPSSPVSSKLAMAPSFTISSTATSSSSFSHEKKPTAIPGLDLAYSPSGNQPVASEPAPPEEQSKEVLASLGKIVSQLQTLKGLSSSLKLLENLPGVKEKQQEAEKEEETKRTVAALLKDESDSEGEQSREPFVKQDKPPSNNLDLPPDSSPPAREFDGYHIRPEVYNISESEVNYAESESHPHDYNLPRTHPAEEESRIKEYAYDRNTADWERGAGSDHLKHPSHQHQAGSWDSYYGVQREEDYDHYRQQHEQNSPYPEQWDRREPLPLPAPPPPPPTRWSDRPPPVPPSAAWRRDYDEDCASRKGHKFPPLPPSLPPPPPPTPIRPPLPPPQTYDYGHGSSAVLSNIQSVDYHHGRALHTEPPANPSHLPRDYHPPGYDAYDHGSHQYPSQLAEQLYVQYQHDIPPVMDPALLLPAMMGKGISATTCVYMYSLCTCTCTVCNIPTHKVLRGTCTIECSGKTKVVCTCMHN